MINQYLSEDRKKFINNKVESIKSKHSKSGKLNFSSITKDIETLLIEIDRIIIPTAFKTFSGKMAIVIPKNFYFLTHKEVSLAHEVGHIILGHLDDRFMFEKDPGTQLCIDEEEAEYFSEKLVGLKESYYKVFIDCFIHILRNPITAFKNVFDLNNKDLYKLARMINTADTTNYIS